MKALGAILVLSLSIATLTASVARADPQFGTRAWFDAQQNNGR
jgi:hypothetical protein